ncbi:MAG: O-antigen ligase family protein [Leptolinea sp.]
MRQLTRALDFSTLFFWAVLLFLLPITSMPAVRDLLHTSVVAGPSVLALAGLLLVGFLPYAIKGGDIPRTVLPLVGFFLACLFSINLSEFIQIPTFKDAGNIRSTLSALFTLLVGIGFLLVTYSQITSERAFFLALRWIYAGGAVMILWSILQSSVWFADARYPAWMRDLQDVFSLGPLYRQRAAGFALEPSWLAHMLNMLYLPVWLSSVYSGYSAFTLRIFKRISIEMILLALGGLVLVLTFSRVGWITFAFMAAFLITLGNIRLVRWIQGRFKVSPGKKVILTIGISCLLIIAYLAILIVAAYGMSRFDPRMKDIFSAQFWQLNNMNRYANALQFGERVVYWQAGWEVFNRYPLAGVGLGNAGKWFAETIPAYGVNLIEVRRLLYRTSEIPNIKNLWIRILAETGIIGFAFFSAWIFSLGKKASVLRQSASPIYKMLGYLGIFVIIGILLEGFSIDSFALPYFWISAGLVLSSGRIKRTSNSI